MKPSLSVSRISASFLSLVAFFGSVVLFCATCYSSEKPERWTRAPRSAFVEVVKEASRSVVSIQGEKKYEVSSRDGSRMGAQYDVFNGMGTGVVIDERGYILTNYHVVKGLLKLEVIAADGERYRDVELIRNDVETDLAILKIKPRKPLHKMRMGRSDRVELAEDVFAIGNPYGYHCSITRGIVSSLDRPLEVNEQLSYERVIQTDAAINPGNSGGPLVNIDGEMIGLNAAVREDAENIAFAIPIDVVCEVAERMMRQTVAKMTHHGLKFQLIDVDDPNYPADGDGRDYLVVRSVDPKSPGASAGVKPGDLLLSSNGFETRNSLDFTCSLIGLGLSDLSELELERAGETLDTSIAFSGLARSTNREIELVHSVRKPAYASSEVEESFASDAENAQELASYTGAPRPGSQRSETKKRSVKQTILDVFGVEATTVGTAEYRADYPKLQAVAIGEFNFAPTGGVRIVDVAPTGIFTSGDVPLQVGDLVFGFGVGNEKEGQLSVASVDNLYYIAQQIDEFAKQDGGKARVYLIRGNKPYFLELDLELH